MPAPAGQLLDLRGSAYDRGRLQAQLRPDRIADVTVAVTRRLRELGPALAVPKVIAWLDAQHAFMRDNDPDGYVEVQGIAEGFGIAADALFACYYGNVIADLAGVPSLAEACTAWAAPRGEHGPVVAKNRDARRIAGGSAVRVPAPRSRVGWPPRPLRRQPGRARRFCRRDQHRRPCRRRYPGRHGRITARAGCAAF